LSGALLHHLDMHGHFPIDRQLRGANMPEVETKADFRHGRREVDNSESNHEQQTLLSLHCLLDMRVTFE
jgi:hypothetical protein